LAAGVGDEVTEQELDNRHAAEMKRACLEFCASYSSELARPSDRNVLSELLRNAGLAQAVAGELSEGGEGWN